MARLSEALRSELRHFAFYLGNRTLAFDILGHVDDSVIFEEPSELETVFAIFGNVIELDGAGNIINPGAAMRRAAQYIRSYCDPNYEVIPPFEAWELELH